MNDEMRMTKLGRAASDGWVGGWPLVFCALGLLLWARPALAWFDAGWPFRREISVAWEAEKAQGSEVALADVYTAGHQKEDGSDLRVASDDGRVVASRVLGAGPGDHVRVVFA